MREVVVGAMDEETLAYCQSEGVATVLMNMTAIMEVSEFLRALVSSERLSTRLLLVRQLDKYEGQGTVRLAIDRMWGLLELNRP